MKRIESRDNASFRHALKLYQSARERRKLDQTVLDGVHLVHEYLASGGAPELVLATRAGREDEEIAALLARVPEGRCAEIADALFEEISSLKTPSGILAVIRTPRPAPLPRDAGCCLMLEDIQDPGNVGSALRSAAAAGVRHVVLSRGCTFAWAPRVVRAAMGAHFRLRIHEQVDLLPLLAEYRGASVAASPRGEVPHYRAPLSGRVAIVVGNEGAGLSPEVAAAVGCRAAIPMATGAESLNAAAAAAVLLFERVRQRLDAGLPVEDYSVEGVTR